MSMKNKYQGFLLATTGGIAAMSGAQAADMPLKARAISPAPVATWEGLYVGAHLGGGWQTGTGDYGAASGDCCGLSGHGGTFTGGLQIGYNWQANNIVYGVEADFAGFLGKAVGRATGDDDAKGNGLENKIDWVSTFRGRLGWLMHPETMLYATGGLAVGHVKNVFAPNGMNASCDPAGCQKSVSKTKVGWAVGAGMEHKLNHNWSLGLEVMYIDLGTTTGSNADGSKTSPFRNAVTTGKLKLNYKF